MNNLFNEKDVVQILERLKKLPPHAEKQWGTMTVNQMLAHCVASLETAMGRNTPKKLNFMLRLIGSFMKSNMISEKPMARNMPTDKSYIITGQPDFDTEKAKVMQLIQTFYEGGPSKCTTAPQVFFGKMKPEEWATMQWKHFDHHLRQFNVH